MTAVAGDEGGAAASGGRTVYVALLALAALDAIGYSIVAPVIPTIARTTHTGSGLAGALVACFGLGQLGGYALAATVGTRYRARTFLGVGLLLICAGDVGFIARVGLPVYSAARVVQGFGAGGLWMGVTLGTLERYPGDGYARLLGVLSAYSIGGIAGPLIGGIGGIAAPFVAHLGLVAVGVAATSMIGAPLIRYGGRTGMLSRTIWTRPFVLASIATLGVATSVATLEGPMPLHLAARLTQSQIGGLYACGAVFLGVSALAANRFGPRAALIVGISLSLVGIGALGASRDVGVWIAAVVVAGTGAGLGEAGSLGMFLESTGTAEFVAAMAIWAQFWAGGYLLGPIASGLAIARLGYAAAVLAPGCLAAFTVAWMTFARLKRRPA